MYDFILNMNIFVLVAMIISLSLLATFSFSVLETVVMKTMGKDKKPFKESVMNNFDEITQ